MVCICSTIFSDVPPFIHFERVSCLSAIGELSPPSYLLSVAVFLTEVGGGDAFPGEAELRKYGEFGVFILSSVVKSKMFLSKKSVLCVV